METKRDLAMWRKRHKSKSGTRRERKILAGRRDREGKIMSECVWLGAVFSNKETG